MTAPSESEVEPLPAPSYPTIEALVETVGPGELESTFASVREGLAALKGPRADQAKKVETALQSAEELLGVLLGIRDQLEEERRAGGRRR